MKPKLLCVDAVPTYTEIELADAPVIFGRSLDADYRFDDTWTSRFHCRIDKIDGRLVVRDLGSSNGTLVNGDRIDESEIGHGDRVTIGISTFELSAPGINVVAQEQPKAAIPV